MIYEDNNHSEEDSNSEVNSTDGAPEETSSQQALLSEIDLSVAHSALMISKKASPLILSSCIVISGTFLRKYLLSRLKKEEFAAADLVYNVQGFLFSPIMSLIGQNSVFISSQIGKVELMLTQDNVNSLLVSQENRKVGAILRQGWMLSLASGVVISAIVPLFKPFFIATGVPHKIADSAESYLLPFMISIPFSMANTVNQGFLIATNQEKWYIPFTIFSVGSGMLLDYFFITSLDSIRGAAWSRVSQSIANFLLYSLFFKFYNKNSSFKLFSGIKKEDFSFLKRMLSQGWPYALRSLVISAEMLYISILISHYGGKGLIIDQIARFYFNAIEIIPEGIASAGNKIVAQSLGIANLLVDARAFRKVRQHGNIITILSQITFSSLALPLILFRKPLVKFFNLDDMEDPLLLYIFLGLSVKYFFNVLRRSLTSNLSALEDTFFASSMSAMTTMFVTIPIVMGATYGLDWGLAGIYFAMGLGTFADTLPVGTHWFKTTNSMVDNARYEPDQTSSNAWFENKMVSCKSLFSSTCCSFFRSNVVVREDSSDEERETLIRGINVGV